MQRGSSCFSGLLGPLCLRVCVSAGRVAQSSTPPLAWFRLASRSPKQGPLSPDQGADARYCCPRSPELAPGASLSFSSTASPSHP
eukprot:6388744-Pyramimonas_sp.AAC.1